ncbi:MAG TPA: hypothetical protein VIE43_03405 [Thermoanaerobaculia bacterium]|jgi:hypothetical protein|nr:hypothetical protein [Thermoanaerobaculia bacterium]
MNPRVLVVLAGCAAAIWAVRRWRLAVQLVMVLLIFEGAIRKWVFPDAQDLVYFAKDVLLLGVYAGFFRERPQLRLRFPRQPVLYAVLAFGALFGVMEIFNPALPNLLVGIFGFKAYFFYVPLLFVLPAAFRSDAELHRFLWRYALTSIPVGLLAIAQFFSPASSFLNTYARSSEDAYVATFGSSTYVRVTATFSFITGYAAYLMTAVILILTLVAAGRWRFRGHLLLFGALGMTLLGMLMSGSRGPVLILILLFPFYWWLAVIRERGGFAAFGRLVIVLALVAGVLASTGNKAVDAFLGRAAGVGDVSGRVNAPLLTPWELLPQVGLLGFGIGATHQTAAALAPGVVPYSWLHGLTVEVESGRIILELGPLGFLFVYFARLLLTFYALRQARGLRTRFHRALATASFLFFLAALPGGVVFDVTSDLFYWFFAGLLMTVVRLDQETGRKTARAAAPSPRIAEGIPAPALQGSPG